MPCDSSYLAASSREIELRETAQLLEYALRELGRSVEPWVSIAAADYYGKGGEDAVPHLCALLKSLDEQARDALVYNARSPRARKLADWWERHLAADRQREADELAEAERTTLRNAALAKLTPAERKAMGV